MPLLPPAGGGGVGGPAATFHSSLSSSRFRDLSLCLLTVVRTLFWEAIQALHKLVEFRSPRHRITFVEGMCLLFSLPAAERLSGKTALLAARVLEIVILIRAEAYGRFPREGGDCNLRSLCQGWGTDRVQCFVLDPHRIEVAHDLVHLAVGNLGILRQIRDSDGCARFCLRRQVGSTETVRLCNGRLVLCTYVQTWPRPADPASCCSDRVEPGNEGWSDPDHEADDGYQGPDPTSFFTVLGAADAGYGDDAAGQAAADRRRRPFFSGHDPGAAASPVTSFLDHVHDFLSSVFGGLFESRGLDSRPGAGHLVSDAHIAAVTDVMDDLHAGLPASLVVGATERLQVPLSSWETMQPGKMIDDTCVDRMAACVADAA